MELSELLTEVRSYIAEPEAGFITDTEITRWLNLAQYDVVNKTECLESKITLSETGSEFALPSDCLKVKWVLYNGDRLTYIPFTEYLNVSSRTDTGVVSHYTLRRHNLYLCYASDTANEITVYYVEIPDELSASDDIPFNEEDRLVPFHNLLVLYAAYRAKLKAREADAGSMAQEYSAGLQNMKEMLMPYQPRYIREVPNGD